MLPMIFGVIVLVLVIYAALKIVKSILIAAVLIGLVFVASYLIMGVWPDLQDVPIIGRWLPEFPTGNAVLIIRNVFYKLDVISVARDAENNLLVTVSNTGKLSLSHFEVLVGNETANIINDYSDPLQSGRSTTLQTDWNGDFEEVVVNTDHASAKYVLEKV
jgi:hypothetical protein